jgi:hypothetical protein
MPGNPTSIERAFYSADDANFCVVAVTALSALRDAAGARLERPGGRMGTLRASMARLRGEIKPKAEGGPDRRIERRSL